jgi:hypothetical protein
MELYYYNLFFSLIEGLAFILPALPSSLWLRLLILIIYFVAHYNKLQYKYVKFKNKYIQPKIHDIPSFNMENSDDFTNE